MLFLPGLQPCCLYADVINRAVQDNMENQDGITGHLTLAMATMAIAALFAPVPILGLLVFGLLPLSLFWFVQFVIKSRASAPLTSTQLIGLGALCAGFIAQAVACFKATAFFATDVLRHQRNAAAHDHLTQIVVIALLALLAGALTAVGISLWTERPARRALIGGLVVIGTVVTAAVLFIPFALFMPLST